MDSGLARAHEGAGIGLAVTQGSVATLGGNMSIDSMPNGGATARIVPPVAETEAAPQAMPEAEAAAQRPHLVG